MYSEKKNKFTVWVFAAVIVLLALLVVFYKAGAGETSENAETTEQNVEQPKPAEQKPAEQPKPAVETFHETSRDEQRKNAEMRENEETVGDAIPESNPAEQKESEDLESV